MTYSKVNIYDHEAHIYPSFTYRSDKHRQYKRILFCIICVSLLLLSGITLWYTNFLHKGTGLAKAPKPITTDLITTYDGTKEIGEHLNKRAFSWSLGMKIFNPIALPFSIYGTVNSCKAFHQNNQIQDGIGCVFSAITTAVLIGSMAVQFTPAGAAASAATQTYELAGTGIARRHSNPFKRSKRHVNMDMVKSMDDYLTKGFGMQYRFHGLIHFNSTQNGHMVPDDYITWPVFELINSDGHVMHHTVKQTSNTTYLHRLGHAHHNTKRGTFNDEYFTSGGIDFSSCHDKVNPDSLHTQDFNNVRDDIKCAVPNLKQASELQYQTYDNANHETIGSGSIAPFKENGQMNIKSHVECPSDIPFSGCGADMSQ